MSRNFAFNTGNGITFFVGSNDFIGFNTQTPSEKLDLTIGNAKFASNVYILSNLSIGSSNPSSYRLNVTGPASISGDVTLGGSMNMSSPLNVLNGLYIQKSSNALQSSSLSTAVLNYSVTSAGSRFILPDSNAAFSFWTSNISNIVTFKGTGEVGIGTSNPIEKLHVKQGNILTESNCYVIQRLAVGHSNPLTSLHTVSPSIRFESSSNDFELQLVSSNMQSSISSSMTGTLQTSCCNNLLLSANSNLILYTRSNTGGQFQAVSVAHNTGNMLVTTKCGVGQQFLGSSNDTSNLPGFTFADDSNTGIFHATAKNLGITINGIETIRFNSNGIGIGVSNHILPLHVNNGPVFINRTTRASPSNAVNGSNGDVIILAQGTTTSTPYSIGLDSNVMWYGVPTTGSNVWYHGINPQMRLYNGRLTCTDDVQGFGTLSDSNLKENVISVTAEESLKIIKDLRPVTFKWKSDIFNERMRNVNDVGFLAQEVENVIPFAVNEYGMDTHGSFKSLKHERIIPYLTGAIQALVKEVEDLKKQISVLLSER